MIFQVMEAHTYYLIAFVGHGSYVDIFSMAIASDQLDAQVNELLDSIRKRDLQYLAGVEKSYIMLSQAEQVELLIFLIPIATDPFKATGSVGKSMGTYRN